MNASKKFAIRKTANKRQQVQATCFNGAAAPNYAGFSYMGLNIEMMFESKKAMEDYKAGEIYKSIIENPDWTDFLVRDFEVHAEATEIQNRLKEKAA